MKETTPSVLGQAGPLNPDSAMLTAAIVVYLYTQVPALRLFGPLMQAMIRKEVTLRLQQLCLDTARTVEDTRWLLGSFLDSHPSLPVADAVLAGGRWATSAPRPRCCRTSPPPAGSSVGGKEAEFSKLPQRMRTGHEDHSFHGLNRHAGELSDAPSILNAPPGDHGDEDDNLHGRPHPDATRLDAGGGRPAGYLC
jgi:hypothetical protein